MIEDDDLSGAGDWTRPGVYRCAPDVYRIPLPLPMDGLRAVNVYAIRHGDEITVLYLEVYGSKKLPAWKQYGDGAEAVRLFDVASVSSDLLAWDLDRISAWRQRNEQTFADEAALGKVAEMCGVQVTPRLFEVDADALPAEIEPMRAFLEPYRHTLVAGVETYRDGASTGALPGRLVRGARTAP